MTDAKKVLQELNERQREWIAIYGKANYAENLVLATNLGDALREEIFRREVLEEKIQQVREAIALWDMGSAEATQEALGDTILAIFAGLESPCGDYPAPCTHEPAHRRPNE